MLYLDTSERLAMLERHGFCAYIAKGLSSSTHGHSFLEFTYVEKGVIEHTFGNCTEILKEGDYFIVDYGTKHGYKSADSKEVSVINLLFYPDFIDRTLSRDDNFEKVVNSYLVRFKYRSLNRSPDGIRFHDDNGDIYKAVKNITKEFLEHEAGFAECIRCLLAQILIITMRKITKSETSESGVIKSITDDIKKNYSLDLKLSDYCKKYNYSLSHISKKFKEEVGMGFMQYIQRIRIEKACRLLETDSMLIGEIAEQVGYNNIKFFNRVFKSALGMTPREFKKMSK